MLEKNLIFIPWNTRIYPGIPRNTQEYLEIAESKKGSRKYPTLHFNTPTQPEPNPLSGIFSNTWPESGQVLKNPIRWALLLTAGPSSSSFQPNHPKKEIVWNSAKWKKIYFSLSLGCDIFPPPSLIEGCRPSVQLRITDYKTWGRLLSDLCWTSTHCFGSYSSLSNFEQLDVLWRALSELSTIRGCSLSGVSRPPPLPPSPLPSCHHPSSFGRPPPQVMTLFMNSS